MENNLINSTCTGMCIASYVHVIFVHKIQILFQSLCGECMPDSYLFCARYGCHNY